MGKGNTVRSLEEINEEFRSYLKTIRTELEADAAGDRTELQKVIVDFYDNNGNKWDYSNLMQADMIDVQQSTSFSLENVTRIIDEVKNALFALAPAPDGVKIEKPANFVASIANMADLNMLVAGRAFTVIQGILQTFAVEKQYNGKKIVRAEQIAPGLMLFVSIRSDIWTDRRFFNNSKIAQYIYIMRAFFSTDQAGDISKFNSLLAFEELATAWRTRMTTLAQAIANPDTPFTAIPALEEEAGYYRERLSVLDAQILELKETKKPPTDEGHPADRMPLLPRHSAAQVVAGAIATHAPPREAVPEQILISQITVTGKVRPHALDLTGTSGVLIEDDNGAKHVFVRKAGSTAPNGPLRKGDVYKARFNVAGEFETIQRMTFVGYQAQVGNYVFSKEPN